MPKNEEPTFRTEEDSITRFDNQQNKRRRNKNRNKNRDRGAKEAQGDKPKVQTEQTPAEGNAANTQERAQQERNHQERRNRPRRNNNHRTNPRQGNNGGNRQPKSENKENNQ
jgi:hypothetical protein